jgi:hypothetical protein
VASQRWQQLREFALSDAWFSQEVDSVKATISDAAARNYQRWATAIADPQFPSWQALFDAEVQQLKQWTLGRLAWLDAAFAAQASPTAPADAYVAGTSSYVAPPPVAGTTATADGFEAAVGAVPAAPVAVQG